MRRLTLLVLSMLAALLASPGRAAGLRWPGQLRLVCDAAPCMRLAQDVYPGLHVTGLPNARVVHHHSRPTRVEQPRRTTILGEQWMVRATMEIGAGSILDSKGPRVATLAPAIETDDIYLKWDGSMWRISDIRQR